MEQLYTEVPVMPWGQRQLRQVLIYCWINIGADGCRAGQSLPGVFVLCKYMQANLSISKPLRTTENVYRVFITSGFIYNRVYIGVDMFIHSMYWCLYVHLQ